MESRKVQKVGYSTMTVSLPSEWVKQNNINPGDLLFILPEKDGALRIMPSQIAQKEEAEEYIVNADACDEQGMLERIVVGSYILGRDVIRVTSSKRIEKAHVDEIRRIIRKLIGLGILEETPRNILLQCSVDPTKFKLDMLVRRLSLIASTILSEAMQALLENNVSLANEAVKREDEADTIYYLAVRLLLSAQMKPDIAEQIGATDVLFIPATRLILQYLELIADYSEDMAKKIIELETYRDRVAEDFVEKIFRLGELAQTIFQKAVDCVFAHDIKVANGILEMHNVLEIEADRLMREAPEIPYLRAIISCLNKIADIGATIADISINRALEKLGKDIENVVRSVKHVRTLPLTSRTKT
ncbi:MAG: phosphate uptake regulator PhoU [Candidatus Bathyarchaeota archaeon]|nr:phosphate uptake regulator PhoU [Candidatus Bathyarchaeota archaeon]MDH5788710.1 phosphate uptake regulator PhoU [Candidatus Bathyarchaeota archaeon]